jgi:hypothetical protein
METFTENNAEERMQEIVGAAHDLLAVEDQPGRFGKEIQVIVADLDKPELSPEARGHLDELVAKVREGFGDPGAHADGEIEAALRSLLSHRYI